MISRSPLFQQESSFFDQKWGEAEAEAEKKPRNSFHALRGDDDKNHGKRLQARLWDGKQAYTRFTFFRRVVIERGENSVEHRPTSIRINQIINLKNKPNKQFLE